MKSIKILYLVVTCLLIYSIGITWCLCWCADWIFGNVSSDTIIFTEPFIRNIIVDAHMLSANYFPFLFTGGCVVGLILLLWKYLQVK